MVAFSSPSTPLWAPFRIAPQFVGRIWGTRDLRPWYDRIAGEEPIGEAWLTGDDCLAATGAHIGKALGELFATAPEAMLGASAKASGSPLLIKVIFAREKLSVQVHPDDRMARKHHEPRGKAECWYVLEAEPGARVACGLKPGTTLDQVKAGIEAGTLEDSLKLLDVKTGEMVFVDAGTVHAIWPGSILLETQQNCDLTYRMYDYGRGRELHIQKSLEATRMVTRSGKVAPRIVGDRSTLIDEKYFRVEEIVVEGQRTNASLAGTDKPEPGVAYLFAAAGTGRIGGPGLEPFELPMGGIAAVPAKAPEFLVEDLGGLKLIRIAPGRLAGEPPDQPLD